MQRRDVQIEPAARCDGCSFEWYGETAADGLRALGRCIRCGGHVTFPDRGPRRQPPALEMIDPRLQPHQVMGAPRLPG
jgi:hypothetical protein